MDLPLKGEIGIDAGGKRWRLVFAIDAMAALEATFDKSMNDLSALLHADMRAGDLVEFFHAGLLEHQPTSTRDDAKALIGHLGITTSVAYVVKAWRAAFAIEEAAPAPDRPRRARAGGGTG